MTFQLRKAVFWKRSKLTTMQRALHAVSTDQQESDPLARRHFVKAILVLEIPANRPTLSASLGIGLGSRPGGVRELERKR
jgi:hypothetical protein